MNVKEIIKKMTLEEKALIVSGTNFMFTNSISSLDIKSIEMSDGPHGLRKQKESGNNGTTNSEPSTSFPTASCVASSWNVENAYKIGEAIALECNHYGVNVLLGPGINIKRNPRGGRNFEYFSEDPLLAAKMATNEVIGLQENGVGASVKHFALNNEEDFRFMGNSICDMRSIREIYLKPFEYVVKNSNPYTIMCAYNQINGTYCSQNEWLLNKVLRDEWKYDGLLMTDWGAMHDRVASLNAGLDLEMPGDCDICRKWIIDGVKNNTLKIKTLDKAVENVLNLINKFDNEKTNKNVDFKEHHKLAASIAEDCAVLLKNNNCLPLNKDEKLFIVGDLFEKMRYQGAGSSMINPMFLTTPKDSFDNNNVNYEFARGYNENQTQVQEDLIKEAINKSNDYDKIIVYAGLTDYVESEGSNRKTISLPENQLALIDALIKTNKKIIVILFGGSIIELPFKSKVDAILDMFLPGQNGGLATYNLIFGNKTPSGKLSETWVKSYEDVPFYNEFSKSINEVYKESVFVGYRYYLTYKKEVLYPFGYGLSYTTFKYEDIKIVKNDDKYEITCKITNTGNYDGAEIVQLYVKAPKSNVFKPEKELRAFDKVYLKTNESKQVKLTFNQNDLRYWNISLNDWVLENGNYEVQICSDCQTIKLKETIKINAKDVKSPYSKEVLDAYNNNLLNVTDDIFEKMSGLKIPALPPKKPLTLESRFTDFKQTFMGRILFNAVLSVATKQLKKAKKMKDGKEKDNCIKGAYFLKRILESNSVNSLSMCAGKSLPYNFAQGFVYLANGHLFKAVKCFIKKIKVK